MKKLAVLIGGVVLSQAVVLSTAAQEPGVGTPTPPPYHKATAQEKAAGKAQRRSEGRAAVAEGSSSGEVTPVPAPQAKLSKEERQAGRAARKAETARAAKAGEIKPLGEVGQVK